MNDEKKTKAQLIEEVRRLRRCVTEREDGPCGTGTGRGEAWFPGQKIGGPGTYLRTVFDKTPYALIVHDPTGRVVDVNEKTLRLFRCTREEALQGSLTPGPSAGKSFWQDSALFREKVMAGEEGSFEWKAKRPGDGSIFDVEVSVSILPLCEGDFTLFSIMDVTDRTRVEQELRATKEYLKTVLNNIRDATYVHDLEGKILDVNDKMLEMHGCSREEAIGSTIRDFSAADNPFDRMPQVFRKVIAGQDQFFEWKCKRPGGDSVMDVEVFLTRLSLPGGDFILSNVHDMSTRKRLDEELRSTKDYLRTVFHKIHDALFVHDVNGIVVDVNEKVLELYQCTREEALSAHIHRDFSEPDTPLLDHHRDVLWRKVMAGEDQLFEWKARRPGDGSVFDVEVCLSKLSLPRGDFILASCRDITQRKAMEELLVREREVFFSVMNDNPHGIALFDNSGRFVYFNPEFTAITGYTLRDVPTGREWIEHAYPEPEYRKRVVDFWRTDKLPKGRGRDVEWRIACRDGQHKDIEFRVTYLGDKSLVVLTDTTARNRAEEELRAEKQNFQVLSERSPVGMLKADPDNRITYINPKFKKLFGYDLADIPDMNAWSKRAHPGSPHRHERLPQRRRLSVSVRPGEGRPYVRNVACKDGREKYVNFIPVRLETGDLLMTCEDITRKKEAERKIRERNLELEVLNDIIGSVSSSLHLPDILETLKKVCLEKLKIPAGGVFFCGEPGGGLSMEMCWGVPDAVRDDFEAFALERYSAGMLAGEKRLTPARNRGFSAEFRKNPGHPLLGNGRRYLAAPLFAKGEIEGMMLLIDNGADLSSSHQPPFFRTLVRQIGVAVQNGRLFEQVRRSHSEMKALSLRLVRVQEAELRHVARELHDEIGQLLTGLRLSLEVALESRERPAPNLEEARSHASTLASLVRELSRNLRPSMLDDLGLLPTLPWLFERFSSQTGIRVTFEHSDVHGKRFSREMETAVYRVVQEALTNVARYARVNRVTVRLWSTLQSLGVQIEDRGVGFDSLAIMKTGNCNGLTGMRERVMLLGGQFNLETECGSGTRLTAELPMDMEGGKI